MKKNNKHFDRKSKYNKERSSYLDSSFNYVYEHDGKREIIPYRDELRELFEYLDESDHEMDLQDRRERENRILEIMTTEDKNTSALKIVERVVDEYCTEISSSESEESADDFKLEFEEWITTLPDSQQDLIYKHFGMGMSFEEIRLEEERNGKYVTKQAIHNRWKKIQEKIKKKFGCYFPN